MVSFVYSFLVSDWSLADKINQESGNRKQNLELFFKNRSYMSVCIWFINMYKHKYTCIRTYKHNKEKITSEFDENFKTLDNSSGNFILSFNKPTVYY